MSITQLEIGDAVSKFVNQPTPILFIDTCAILDIVRLPFREKNPTTAKAHLDSAQNALKLVADRKLRIVILPLVQTEFGDNFPNTKNELSRHITAITKSLEVLKELHVSNTNQLVVPDLSILNTESFFEGICRSIISVGVHIKLDNSLVLKAADRVVRNIPPSRKGAVKDCIIYEHCLEISTLLRSQGFVEKIVFFTSNTKDFCDGNGHAKQQINIELSHLNIGLCLTWSWAINDII